MNSTAEDFDHQSKVLDLTRDLNVTHSELEKEFESVQAQFQEMVRRHSYRYALSDRIAMKLIVAEYRSENIKAIVAGIIDGAKNVAAVEHALSLVERLRQKHFLVNVSKGPQFVGYAELAEQARLAAESEVLAIDIPRLMAIIKNAIQSAIRESRDECA